METLKSKKIAILVGGMYREFDNAHKSWSFLKYDNIDFYISTWDKTYETNNRLSTNIFEDVTEDRIKSHISNANIKISQDLNIDNGQSFYIRKLIYHWKTLITMVNNSGKKYDIAILTRPDFFIKENVNFVDFINTMSYNKVYTLTNVCVLPTYPFVYTNDCFFIANFSHIEKMINYLEPISEYYDIHIYLSKYLIENKIDVESISPNIIEYYVFRSIHRKTQNLNFYDNKKIGIEWWNIKNNEQVSDELVEKIKKYL